MKKQMTLLNWNSEQAESISGKFRSAGWDVDKQNDESRQSYSELLHKRPGVLMSSSGAASGGAPDQANETLPRRQNGIGLPDFILEVTFTVQEYSNPIIRLNLRLFSSFHPSEIIPPDARFLPGLTHHHAGPPPVVCS